MNPPDNQLRITACISEAQSLRFTPAGLPALDLMLDHQSSVNQEQHTRQVQARIKALAVGAIAESLARQPIGSHWRFSGFVTSPRGKGLLFHIQAFSQD